MRFNFFKFFYKITVIIFQLIYISFSINYAGAQERASSNKKNCPLGVCKGDAALSLYKGNKFAFNNFSDGKYWANNILSVKGFDNLDLFLMHRNGDISYSAGFSDETGVCLLRVTILVNSNYKIENDKIMTDIIMSEYGEHDYIEYINEYKFFKWENDENLQKAVLEAVILGLVNDSINKETQNKIMSSILYRFNNFENCILEEPDLKQIIGKIGMN